MSAYLKIDNVSLNVEQRPILNAINFSIDRHQIGALIGPSGSGKTSLLRCIAGLDQVSHGQIECDGVVINSARKTIMPEKRSVGVVFQNPALFPHLSVRENIGFGIRRLAAQQQQSIIDELVELTNLNKLLDRRPEQLSGGEQQRVAIARALARQPRLLLLDEPFSSLDAGLRPALAQDIGAIIRTKKQTALIVTHDQNEAFAIADVMGVLDEGRLLQHGNSYDLYHLPATRRVANFVGLGIFAKGKVTARDRIESSIGEIKGHIDTSFSVGESIEILLRPDDIIHDDDSPITAKILEKTFRGAVFLYTLLYQGRQKLFCYAPSHHNHKIGEDIGIRLEIDHIICFKEQSRA